MSKKWYTVTFSAEMSEDDVRAMQKCFYDAMEEAMQISPCAGLKIIEEECKCPLGGDEANDCADCAYAGDYHFVDGECVEREEN